MSNTRMVVVVRRDLQMSPGLLAAQVLHIGMGFIQEHAKYDFTRHGGEREAKMYRKHGTMMILPVEAEWIEQPYVAVLAVDTPEELDEVAKSVKGYKLPIHEWHDVIPSKVLEGRFLNCLVGISIGPAAADALKQAAGTLPLY